MTQITTYVDQPGVVGRKFKGTLQTSGNEHSVGRVFVMIRKENTETRKVPRLV
jgi:hypothetical protein